jgi:hemolysin activation/secretion protein
MLGVSSAQAAQSPAASRPGSAEPVASAASSSGAPVKAPSFDVLELRVLGNTHLDTRSIESAIYPFTGPSRNMSDVEAARTALEKAYHDRGFGTVFVDIPEQSVDDGIVRLHVTEARINSVRVTGARYFSDRQILAALPASRPGTVPDLPVLQKEITALNAETRDRVVVPVLKAGPEPGTVDLALKVDDHLPFHGSVEINNQYTADTSHLRVVTAASYDDLFGRLDSLALQYQVAPEAPSESHVVAGSYTTHVGSDGSSLSLQYINSKSDVATIGTLGVLGTGSVYSLRWSHPLPAVGSAQNFALGLDYKDFGQSILVSTGGDSTPASYVNFSALYSGYAMTRHAQWDWSTTLNLGVRGIIDNVDQFADKRYDAAPDYIYIRSDGGVTIALPARLAATFRITGQYSADPLISNEQLALGGAASVRGYLEAEELGDSGVRASFQLGAPPLTFSAGRLHFNEFVFYDMARAVILDPLPGQASISNLRSFGAGLKFDGYAHFYGDLTWADPLVDGSRTLKGDSTVLFDVRSTW